MSGAARVFVCGALLIGLTSPAAAVVLEVDAAAACPGSGTVLAPYCSIGNAAAEGCVEPCLQKSGVWFGRMRAATQTRDCRSIAKLWALD